MSLEQLATDRKNRLAALRNKGNPQERAPAEDEPQLKKVATEKNVIKSRNFDPETRSAVTGFNAPPTVLDENAETVEAVSQKIQNEVLSKFRARSDITSAGHSETITKPRSITWDLQRDIQDDLDSLQEQTDEAIKEIVKQRIRKLREQDSTTEDDN